MSNTKSNEYKKYIEKGINLIKTIVDDSNYKYNDYNYDDREGRQCSIQGELDFLEKLINNKHYELIADNKQYYIYKNILKGFYVIIPTSARFWFDFAIIDNGFFFPVNIKITNDNGLVDNLFGVKVLDYLLFNNYISDENGVRFITKRKEDDIAEDISKSLKLDSIDMNAYEIDNIRDYFFLSIDKKTGLIHIFPFFNIEYDKIVVNPKNAFQINFNNIPEGITDNINFQDNILKLLNLYFDYIEKKAKPFMIINKIETIEDNLDTIKK